MPDRCGLLETALHEIEYRGNTDKIGYMDNST